MPSMQEHCRPYPTARLSNLHLYLELGKPPPVPVEASCKKFSLSAWSEADKAKFDACWAFAGNSLTGPNQTVAFAE
jgi:hypothetical protein